MADQYDVIAEQDRLRTARQFLSVFSGLSGQDQTYGNSDAVAVNQPGQFHSFGPYTASVEGQPIITYSPQQGMTVAPLVVLIGLGVAAFLLLS